MTCVSYINQSGMVVPVLPTKWQGVGAPLRGDCLACDGLSWRSVRIGWDNIADAPDYECVPCETCSATGGNHEGKRRDLLALHPSLKSARLRVSSDGKILVGVQFAETGLYHSTWGWTLNEALDRLAAFIGAA